MALRNQPFFQQRLGGKTIEEIVRQLSYKENRLDKRLKEVEEILNNEPFFIEYLTNHFRADINSGDVISEGINVFLAIEKLATYILNSKEIKEEEDENVTQYKFISDRSYFEYLLRRESTSNPEGNALSCPEKEASKSLKLRNSSDIEDKKPILFYKKNGQNQKLSKDLRITKKDLSREDELGEILRAYDEYLKFINKQIKSPSKLPNGIIPSRIKLTTIKSQIRDDMIVSKRALTGVWAEELQNFSESTSPDYSKIDLTNFNHVYGYEVEVPHPKYDGETITKHIPGLLFLENNYPPGSDMHIILMMLDDAISKTQFIGKQKQVLDMARENCNTRMISEALDIDSQNVSRTLKSAALRVVRTSITLNYGADE